MEFCKPEINVLKFDSDKIATSLSSETLNDGVEAARARAEANGSRAIEVDMANLCF